MYTFLARIEEIYVQPDQPETLLPSQSIRHETKIKANDIYLLQNERTVEHADQLDENNLENRNDKSNYELTKMIANGILAAEALEKSLINKSLSGGPAIMRNHYGEPIDPLPMYLTPPRSFAERPFRYEARIPLRDRNHSTPIIMPIHAHNTNNRFKNFIQPMRKPMNDRPKVTKISMPPIRRDYTTNNKQVPSFPVQNQPWSLQKHIVAMRGSPSTYLSKQKFSGPIKISKKEFALPAKNLGFQPGSVVVEGGFTPIMRRKFVNDGHEHEHEHEQRYSHHMHDSSDADDYPEQTHRRSDKADFSEESSSTESEGTALLIKTFEPMFIPSPLDNMSAMKSPTKRLSGDLQYMEVEDGEDKMALAGERHAYYLPPETDHPKMKSTKLYPAGTVVTYDGRAVVDKSLLDSEPDFPTPNRPGSIMSGISSTEQLLHLPQFGPFRGEIPPLNPELMKPNIVRSQQPRST